MVIAYSALQKNSELKKTNIELPKLEPDQVKIKVINCGICYSDISAIDNAWGKSTYPLIAGHEVVGEIVDLGEDVKLHKMGDMVGLGWHSGYCNSCEFCEAEDHNFCSNTNKTIYGQSGGFAEFVQAFEKSVIPIPKGLDIDKIGPLLCGGITVFTPLLEFNIKKNQNVGVIGIGGLGHLAVKFLKALGCKVTAFSTSKSKIQSIKELGASNFIQSTDTALLEKNKNKFDFIISTVHHKLDWNKYLQCLKPRGRLHFVGATLDPLDLSVFNLMGGCKSVSGSPVGSPKNIIKMLEFVMKNKIYPDVEIFKFDDINKAIQKLRSNKIRYRAVLKW